MTTAASHEQFTRRWNEDVLVKGNLNRIDDMIADDFVMRDPDLPEPVRGPDGAREVVEMLHSAFGDLTVELEEIVSTGDRVAIRNTISGTHDGEPMGIEPRGRRSGSSVSASSDSRPAN